MSLYSNGTIKSVILDPTNYRANSRAVYKLDGERLYKSDLKLANIGVSVSNVNNSPVNNKLAGVGALIKSISLLDGKTELDSCNECHRYYGFQQLLDSNSGNESMNRYLIRNSQGLRTVETGILKNLKAPSKLTTDLTTTPQGIIDLRDVLPLLRNLDMLDTANTFKNLKIVIEFETDTKLTVSDIQYTTTTLEPVLLCDVVEDPSIISGMAKQMPQMVQWNKIEHDVVNVPEAKRTSGSIAVAQGVQPVSKKVRGFDNKRVGRLLAIKTYTNPLNATVANAVRDVGNLGSIAAYDEVFNVRVNGKSILSRKGNDKAPNARLAMLSDTYGDMASYFGSNLTGIDGMAALVDDGLNKLGRLDYFGLTINESIQDLQFSYDRTNLVTTNSTPAKLATMTNAGMDIHLYAEVAKTISFSPNGYNVAYV